MKNIASQNQLVHLSHSIAALVNPVCISIVLILRHYLVLDGLLASRLQPVQQEGHPHNNKYHANTGGHKHFPPTAEGDDALRVIAACYEIVAAVSVLEALDTLGGGGCGIKKTMSARGGAVGSARAISIVITHSTTSSVQITTATWGTLHTHPFLHVTEGCVGVCCTLIRRGTLVTQSVGGTLSTKFGTVQP